MVDCIDPKQFQAVVNAVKKPANFNGTNTYGTPSLITCFKIRAFT